MLGIGIGVVQFANGVCVAPTGLLGTCYRKRQCSEIIGGFASGTCASNLGVCCVGKQLFRLISHGENSPKIYFAVQLSCGTSSNLNNTYFVSTGFPAPFFGSTSCIHTIRKCNSDICQVSTMHYLKRMLMVYQNRLITKKKKRLAENVEVLKRYNIRFHKIFMCI